MFNRSMELQGGRKFELFPATDRNRFERRNNSICDIEKDHIGKSALVETRKRWRAVVVVVVINGGEESGKACDLRELQQALPTSTSTLLLTTRISHGGLQVESVSKLPPCSINSIDPDHFALLSFP